MKQKLRKSLRGVTIGLAALLIMLGIVMKFSNHKAAKPSDFAAFDADAKKRVMQSLGNQPLHFEANHGQTDAQVMFLSRGRGYTLFLTSTESVLALSREKIMSGESLAQETTVVRMKWKGADPLAQAAGTHPLAGKSNYLIGSEPAAWRKNVPSFEKVRYENLYAGIDMVFYGNQQQLEYDFVVAPGSDPNVIRLAFTGEDKLNIDEQGNMVIHSGNEKVVQKAPVVYQEINGARQLVAGSYVMKGKHEVGFKVASYDAKKTLYIDPVFSFSSFFGGNANNYAKAVAVDGSGNIYVTGYTESTTFPTTSGAYRTACSTCSFSYPDVFVTKLSPAGAIIYSTYVGDNNTSDKGHGIAVDSSGNAYVTGETWYPGSGTAFPIVNGFPFTSGNSGAIVFKLNSSGTALLYSTRLQSGSSSRGYGIAVEGSNAYVVGMSVAGQDFPLWPIAGTYSTLIGSGGSYDAFIVKIDTTGSGLGSLSYATRFGDAGWDYFYAAAVDSSGNAYATGYTDNGNANNPREALVVKFNVAGSNFDYATYFGGSGDEYGYGIAVDSAGNAYITGKTESSDFPVTAGAFQSASGGVTDAFVAKLNPAGNSLVYSTYLGGSSPDNAYGIALDSAGNAYLAGDTSSSNFPVTANAMQAVRNGPHTDAFVTALNPTGTALAYSSYLGGSGNVAGGDKAYGITVDSSGNVIVVGQTDSANFPLQNAFQTTHSGGGFDGFVAKIRDDGSSSGGGGGSSSGGSGGGGGGGGCGSIDDSSNGEPPASTMILLFLPLIWLFFRKRFVKIEAE